MIHYRHRPSQRHTPNRHGPRSKLTARKLLLQVLLLTSVDANFIQSRARASSRDTPAAVHKNWTRGLNTLASVRRWCCGLIERTCRGSRLWRRMQWAGAWHLPHNPSVKWDFEHLNDSTHLLRLRHQLQLPLLLRNYFKLLFHSQRSFKPSFPKLHDWSIWQILARGRKKIVWSVASVVVCDWAIRGWGGIRVVSSQKPAGVNQRQKSCIWSPHTRSTSPRHGYFWSKMRLGTRSTSNIFKKFCCSSHLSYGTSFAVAIPVEAPPCRQVCFGIIAALQDSTRETSTFAHVNE